MDSSGLRATYFSNRENARAGYKSRIEHLLAIAYSHCYAFALSSLLFFFQ